MAASMLGSATAAVDPAIRVVLPILLAVHILNSVPHVPFILNLSSIAAPAAQYLNGIHGHILCVGDRLECDLT